MVLSRAKGAPMATIAWGWESEEFYRQWLGEDNPAALKDLKGPVLNLASTQSSIAPPLLDLVRNVLLADPAYVERVKSHYAAFREVIDRRGSRGRSLPGPGKRPRLAKRPSSRRRRSPTPHRHQCRLATRRWLLAS